MVRKPWLILTKIYATASSIRCLSPNVEYCRYDARNDNLTLLASVGERFLTGVGLFVLFILFISVPLSITAQRGDKFRKIPWRMS